LFSENNEIELFKEILGLTEIDRIKCNYIIFENRISKIKHSA
jgi:hypothetical protein